MKIIFDFKLEKFISWKLVSRNRFKRGLKKISKIAILQKFLI